MDCRSSPIRPRPGGWVNGKFADTLADIDGFSLITISISILGEGGVLVTEEDELADRLMLISNYAEADVGDKGIKKSTTWSDKTSTWAKSNVPLALNN